MNQSDNQALALVGLLHSIMLVNAVAHGKDAPPEDMDLMFAATVNLNPESGEELLPSGNQLEAWIRNAIQLLSGQGENLRLLRYPQQILDLCNRLQRDSTAERKLGMLLGACHPPNAQALADIYQKIISPLGRRILVSGNPQVLQNVATATRIRALLLASVRFGWWWKQTGGRRWHLVFKRNALIEQLVVLEKQL